MKKMILALILATTCVAPAFADSLDATLAAYMTTRASYSDVCKPLGNTPPATASAYIKVVKRANACTALVFDEIDPEKEKFTPNFRLATHDAMFVMLIQIDACNWLRQHAPSRLVDAQYCN